MHGTPDQQNPTANFGPNTLTRLALVQGGNPIIATDLKSGITGDANKEYIDGIEIAGDKLLFVQRGADDGQIQSMLEVNPVKGEITGTAAMFGVGTDVEGVELVYVNKKGEHKTYGFGGANLFDIGGKKLAVALVDGDNAIIASPAFIAEGAKLDMLEGMFQKGWKIPAGHTLVRGVYNSADNLAPVVDIQADQVRLIDYGTGKFFGDLSVPKFVPVTDDQGHINGNLFAVQGDTRYELKIVTYDELVVINPDYGQFLDMVAGGDYKGMIDDMKFKGDKLEN